MLEEQEIHIPAALTETLLLLAAEKELTLEEILETAILRYVKGGQSIE